MTDAGLTQNGSQVPANPTLALEPFVNQGSGFLSEGWSNESVSYPCGSPVGIMYGTLPPPNSSLSMLATGVPAFDPTQMNLPPATTIWSNAAWNFFATPSSLNSSPGTLNGIPTNCTDCSVARMFTLAIQNGNFGQCYGGCTGVPDGRWDNVVAGQLISPCSQIESL